MVGSKRTSDTYTSNRNIRERYCTCIRTNDFFAGRKPEQILSSLVKYSALQNKSSTEKDCNIVCNHALQYLYTVSIDSHYNALRMMCQNDVNLSCLLTGFKTCQITQIRTAPRRFNVNTSYTSVSNIIMNASQTLNGGN